MLSGDEIELWTGDQLEHRETARAGDYLYVPPGVPHVVVNRSEKPAVFVGARSDPNEQERRDANDSSTFQSGFVSNHRINLLRYQNRSASSSSADW